MFTAQVSAYTDKGDIRKENQDRILYRYEKIKNHFIGMFIVADGCGGLEHGEVASNMIISYFDHFWVRLLQGAFDENIEKNKAEALLDNVINQINDACLRYTADFGGKTGSTLSLLFTVDKKFYIKNVGDSRIYKKTLFGLRQITEDQNIVNDMLRSGQLTRKEAQNYTKKNFITMCIGYFSKVYPYSAQGVLHKGDMFLLCSDGLYNYIDVDSVNKIFKTQKVKFSQKAEILRKNISHGNARDNVSCMIVRYI